jgi:pyruvate,water dikinase
MGMPGAADVILSPLVGLARRSARLREDQRFAWQRGLAQLRRLYLLAGRLLVARGALAAPEDVFFLTSDEVREAARGDVADLRDRADRRRAAYDVEQKRFAREGPSGYPPFLRGNRPLAREPSLEIEGRIPGTVDRLQGVAVCPGVGRGTARVVRGPSDLTALQAGEVLVTRGADPGWTLLFDRLAALVTESGGQLSHAAVVAREYRLPAVLAVPRATDVIHTGDELVVDGATGVVTVVACGA